MYFDIFTVFLILSALFVGFYRGFAREFFGLAHYLGIAYIPYLMHPYVLKHVQQYINPPKFASVATFFALFIATFFALKALRNIFVGFFHMPKIRQIDQVFGSFIGGAKGIAISCCFYLVVGTFLPQKLHPEVTTSFFFKTSSMLLCAIPDHEIKDKIIKHLLENHIDYQKKGVPSFCVEDIWKSDSLDFQLED